MRPALVRRFGPRGSGYGGGERGVSMNAPVPPIRLRKNGVGDLSIVSYYVTPRASSASLAQRAGHPRRHAGLWSTDNDLEIYSPCYMNNMRARGIVSMSRAACWSAPNFCPLIRRRRRQSRVRIVPHRRYIDSLGEKRLARIPGRGSAIPQHPGSRISGGGFKIETLGAGTGMIRRGRAIARPRPIKSQPN